MKSSKDGTRRQKVGVRIRKLLALAVTTIAVLAGLHTLEWWPFEPEPGDALPDVRIDVPASRFGPGGNPEAEYVCLVNADTDSVQLAGWELRDRIDHSLILGAHLLEPQAGVRVHTGGGVDHGGDLYANAGDTIWNDDGDTVKLYEAAGRLVDKVDYRALRTGTAPAPCG